MGFDRFPVELQEQVLTFMDPVNILALRKAGQPFLTST